MKPDRSAFDHVGLPVADIDDFYDRLPDRYFTLFPREIQVRHLFQLTDLNPQEPIHVHLEQRADGTVDCTVISYDYPFVFSLITGLLASFGVLIKTGEVFTYAPQSYSRSARVTPFQMRRSFGSTPKTRRFSYIRFRRRWPTMKFQSTG
ncbi:hypothetical protein EBR96_07160 [bacterium]|nr:hypothetical protein [bacterium]